MLRQGSSRAKTETETIFKLNFTTLTDNKIIELIKELSSYNSLTSNFSKNEFIRQTLNENAIRPLFQNLWMYHGNENQTNSLFNNFKMKGYLRKVDNSLMKHSKRYFIADFKKAHLTL